MARIPFSELVEQALAEHGNGRRELAYLRLMLPGTDDYKAAGDQYIAKASDRVVIMLLLGGLRKLMV